MSMSPPVTELTTCDRCPSLGRVRYVMKNDTDLIFCGHHNREVQAAITALPNLQRIDILTHSSE